MEFDSTLNYEVILPNFELIFPSKKEKSEKI